jgi:hypothetical protein
MKVSTTPILAALLAVVFTAPAFAQWAGKSFGMTQPGAGEADKEYYFRVPPNVTLETPKGIFQAGDLIAVPGKRITLLTPEKAEEVLATPQGWANKSVVQAMTPSEKRQWAVIALEVPEGVTIKHADGRVQKGPYTAYLTVYAENLKASEKMKEAPTEMQKMPEGWSQK